MSEEINDLGPAFPRATECYLNDGERDLIVGYNGMSLRDYFAAKALSGIVYGAKGLVMTEADFAERSYAVADAMLKARKKEMRKREGK